jgi:hypothetical protein
LRRTNPAKWQRLHYAERETRLKPTIPIPGEWYDADYFEHGLKSNWTNGYKWDAFAGLFRETAEFLTTMFPEATSYLDAGCAKGFLVRALREKGREAFGFDHSGWALERAEESARPFLRRTKVEEVQWESPVDMLTAFSLFECLTEEQVLAFLQRARGWTRHGLLAVIAVANESKAGDCEDRDLSHVTLRPRAWWHELFLRAGWRQDALHRMAEHVLQRHDLVSRMAWQVFVYAPK